MAISQEILDSQTSLNDVLALAYDQCIKHRSDSFCELFCFADESILYILNNHICKAYSGDGYDHENLSEKRFPCVS